MPLKSVAVTTVASKVWLDKRKSNVADLGDVIDMYLMDQWGWYPAPVQEGQNAPPPDPGIVKGYNILIQSLALIPRYGSGLKGMFASVADKYGCPYEVGNFTTTEGGKRWCEAFFVAAIFASIGVIRDRSQTTDEEILEGIRFRLRLEDRDLWDESYRDRYKQAQKIAYAMWRQEEQRTAQERELIPVGQGSAMLGCGQRRGATKQH